MLLFTKLKLMFAYNTGYIRNKLSIGFSVVFQIRCHYSAEVGVCI